MEVTVIKDLLNTIIAEDLNLKEIIRCIDHIAVENADVDYTTNAEKYLKTLTSDSIVSIEKTRFLLSKLAKSIDELYGKSQQDEFGKELSNYTDQFYVAEGMYKNAVSAAIVRIRNVDRSKLFRKTVQNLDGDNVIRNRLKKSYLEQNIEKSNRLVTDMRQLAADFSQQVELSKRTLDVLNEDSNTLTHTHGVYQEMDTNINTATRLVGKYNRREIWDKVIVSIAFVFFLLVIVYIVIKRITRFI